MDKEKYQAHILDDICDCLIEAFGQITIDKEITILKLRVALERQIRSQQNIAPWFKELIEFEDKRITKH
tara:strand:- start:516 stop:722 length:207 start_codon:yes stop_codon:yes gene_type:complete